MSDFVLHCTRGGLCEEGERRIYRSAFDVLRLILQDGFLRAGFAIGQSPLAREPKPKVRGPYPAVCFTEQPLRFFIQSIKADRRYTEFAVAVRKDQLFNYGGRPVLYTDEEVLGRKLPPKEHEPRNYPPEAWVYEGGLPLDLQYLWVYYDPTAMWFGDRDYPIDFTHEREWRTRPNAELNLRLGLSGQDAEIAVPLQLPTKSDLFKFGPVSPPEGPCFAILVDTDQSRRELIGWIAGTVGQISERRGYWENYAKALQEAPILSFERINDAKDELTRLEDFINDDFTEKDFLFPDAAGF